MNTENTVPTGDETKNASPEPAEKPEVAEPETTEQKPEPEKQDDPVDSAIRKMQRRIDKRTAEIYRTRAENEQLKQKLTELESGSQKDQQQVDPIKLADTIASARMFAAKAESIVDTGKHKHTDYMDALKDLASEVGEFVQPNGLPSKFMAAVLEASDSPADLLYHLGKNPDIADELAKLSPVKLGIRLNKIESDLKMPSQKQVNAPKPLEPVRARSADSSLSDDLPIDEWMKRRESELRAKRGH